MKEMKKISLLLLTGILMLVFNAKRAHAGDTHIWYIETVDSNGHVGAHTSIALDSNNNPHISYYDGDNNNLKYTYYDGSSWHIETVDSVGYVSENTAYFLTSIALDSGDNPHISYYDSDNNDLKYTCYNGISWNIETVDSIGNVGADSSIALDSNNNPHISYYDTTNTNLKYGYYDGSTWHTETVDTAGLVVGVESSLALDINDNPHISYSLGAIAPDDLKYAYYDGSTWHKETVDSFNNVGGDTSIALDSNDNPHISYFYWTANDLKYAYYDGSTWHMETVDSAGDVGWYTSIALDSGDKPHISYQDWTGFSRNDLKYAYYDGSTWHIETVDSAGDVGEFTSIALDSGDNPHISYYEHGSYSLKYARTIPAYTLTITTTDGGATDPTPGTHIYAANSVAEVSAIPDECNEFDHWELDGNDVGPNNPYSVTMDSNHTLHGVFVPITDDYDLTITATSDGTTDPAPGIYTYGCGSSVEVNAIPDPNYVLDHWELDGNDVASANPCTALMDSNHTLHAVFLRNADLNGNCYVGLLDLGIFGDWWLAGDCCELNWCDGADLDESNDVDWADFDIFACQWVKCITDCTCTDMDGDGYANPASVCCLFPELDCNDNDPNINAGAEEICDDSIDNDCDGLTDYADPDCGPECWKCPRQCHGDADCLAQGIGGIYWVSTWDAAILNAAWMTSYPDPNYDLCADFDRDGYVDVNDSDIFNTWFNVAGVPPNCPPGGTWPPE